MRIEHPFLFYVNRTDDSLQVKSVFLIKPAVQYNTSKTDSGVSQQYVLNKIFKVRYVLIL